MEITSDHFVIENGEARAGVHVIADFWNGSRLENAVYVRDSLVKAAEATGATVLDYNFHGFAEDEGVTGVVLLAESHISIHTWPERDFAAVDIFTCGACDPRKAVPILAERFSTNLYTEQILHRGRMAWPHR